jgi:sterol O-acyltransferase
MEGKTLELNELEKKIPGPPAGNLTNHIMQLESALSVLRSEVQKRADSTTHGFERLLDVVDRESDQITDQLKDIKSKVTKELEELVSRVHFMKVSANDMIHELSHQVEGSKSPLASPTTGNKKNASKTDRLVKKSKSGLPVKVFRHQESLLTTLLREDHWNSIRNMFESVFMLFMISALIQEFRSHGKMFHLSLLIWAFGKVSVVIECWCLMFAVTLTPVALFHFWRDKWISTYVYFACIGAIQSYLYWLAYHYCRGYNLPMASALIIGCEQLRFFMKMHAFVVETYRMATSTEETEDAKLDKDIVLKSDEIFSRYFYFLWIPTLVYRNSYPNTSRIRWTAVLEYFTHLSGSILFTYVIFTSYCIPEFENTAHNPGDIETLLMSILQASLPSVTVFLLGF